MSRWKNAMLAGLFAAALAACGESNVTAEGFERLKGGMTLEEVEAILGKGAELRRDKLGFGKLEIDAKKYEWRDGDKVIRVRFQENRLIGRSKEGL